MDELEPGKTAAFTLPYATAISSEAAVRPKDDFWRWRLLSTILRQSPKQIESFKERYNTNLN